MTRFRDFITTLFPADEYVMGLGFISRLPGGVRPCQHDVNHQQPRNENAELAGAGLPTGVVVRGHPKPNDPFRSSNHG